MEQNFLNLPREECLNISKDIFDSAEKHFKNAAHLYSVQSFGAGISLLVLGSEELVKGMLLYLNSLGLQLRNIPGIQKFFKDHKTRHSTVFMCVVMTFNMRQTHKMALRFHDIQHNSEKHGRLKGWDRFLLNKDKEEKDQLLKHWMERKGHNFFQKIMSQMDFWLDANDAKNKGFYVDYKNGVTSPLHVTEQEYQWAYEATTIFKTYCQQAIHFIEALQGEERKRVVHEINSDGRLKDIIGLFLSNNKRSF